MLTPETVILLGSGKKEVDKDKDGKNVPKLKFAEIVLVHCNLVKNDYQHRLKALFTFVLNKQFGQFFGQYFTTLFNNDEHSQYWIFSVEVWFVDQVSKALEIEDNINFNLKIIE